MDSKTKPISVRLSKKTLERLKKKAKELDRPVSWVIRKALEEAA